MSDIGSKGSSAGRPRSRSPGRSREAAAALGATPRGVRPRPKRGTPARQQTVLERLADLLRDTADEPRDLCDGYLDLLGDSDPIGPHPGQRWMASRTLPLIYERLWRPAGGRLLMGAGGLDPDTERRAALDALSLTAGDRVLDVACGPGNFTREFAREASRGIVVGLDASRTMLARAVAETSAPNVAYVRGDAEALPFADDSFDAVCCFAALYLIERPMQAIREIARVLAPGGRVALLASCNRGPLPVALTRPPVMLATGVRLFDSGELAGELDRRGLVDVRVRVSGLAQFVSARRP
ncbi:MAG TPA: methyltransferase domain-containing protein [Solirubrobacteraceae bacterium]|nr:methyltransferase domain-containing protein [Solirubrobacteraceae bacterium]